MKLEEWLVFAQEHPHEFTIQYPPRREYFQENFQTPEQEVSLDDAKELLLYLHVPFCAAKCYYCNFAVDVRNDQDLFQRYTEALLSELRGYDSLREKGISFIGIDIGGGTPTRLSLEQLVTLGEALQPFAQTSSHPFPISIETTPLIASEEREKMQALRSVGIQRVSMGIQSFNAEQLSHVNRQLQTEKNEQAFRNLRDAGFIRINADLIFGLPGQSLGEWRTDLQKIIALKPDSITTYDCLYRGKGRTFTKRAAALHSRQLFGEMYDLAYTILVQAGYSAPYGSVNFSLFPGETGTSAYFEGRLFGGLPYIGLGNYASSWKDPFWFFKERGVNRYIQGIEEGKSVIGDFYHLPPDELMAKYVLYSMNYGCIDADRFSQRFGVSLEYQYAPELEYIRESGWMRPEKGMWRMNEGQFENIALVRSLFYSERAKNWMRTLKNPL